MTKIEQNTQEPEKGNDNVLYEANPAMWRNHPMGFVISILLIPAFGLGVLVLLSWYIEAKMTHISINSRGVLVRRGILSKSRKDVWHRDVRSVYVQQSFTDRMFGVGRVSLYTAGDQPEIDISGIPDPLKVRQLIYDNAGL